jgi:RHS repeat-associated protein
LTTCSSNTETQEPNTPGVDYTYEDTNVTALKDLLTKITTGFSTTAYTDFDPVGQVKKSRQTTDGIAYTEMQYAYNLEGALIEETYPSGRKVKNVIDNGGTLAIVQSKKNGSSGYWNYADSFTYNAAGTVTAMQLGNGHWESTLVNTRLQPKEMNLGTTQGATNLLRSQYDYGKWESGSLNTAKNNGNIGQQVITVPNGGSNLVFTQKYDYDSLNRIKDTTETGSSGQTWRQGFIYDRYGNRNFYEADTTTLTKACGTPPNYTVCASDRKVENPSFDTGSNRFTGDQDGDSVSDYVFDASGNMTRDAQLRKYTYDGENRQVKVETVNSSGTVTGTLGEYVYDGDGKRIKKISSAEIVIFVYDVGGRSIAEYSTNPSQTPKVQYITSDYLGSPRITSDQNGTISSRQDFTPFGEDVAAGRSQGLGYQSSSTRQKFTGHEADSETGLDFVEARYYSTQKGRFVTPDRIAIAPDRLIDPQRLNLYSYARNQPLLYTDPSGEDVTIRITNIVVGTQTIKVNGVSTAVFSYRIVVTNESGTQRTFETTRDPSNGKRGNYNKDGETPPGTFVGEIRRDGKKGFRVEFRDPDQPAGSGRLITPTGYAKTHAQLHRCAGISDGCALFPAEDRDRFETTILAMLAEDESNQYGQVISVVINPRNPDDKPAGKDLPSNEARAHDDRDGADKSKKPPPSPHKRPKPLPGGRSDE